MFRRRSRMLWAVLIGAIALVGITIPLWVTADSGEPTLTATLYSDVIRFEADGVASLRLTIYDLAENELWTSGLIPGDFADWDRTNAAGERLANGYYLYLAQGWDASDSLILNKAGKVVLLPGDQVELKAAPSVGGAPAGSSSDEPVYQPMAYDTTNWYVSNRLGVGTDTPAYSVDVAGYVRSEKLMCTDTTPQMRWYETDAADDPNDYMRHEYGGNKYRMQWRDDSAGTWFNALTADGGARTVGINTVTPATTLDVYGTSNINWTSDGIVNIGDTSSWHVTLDDNELHGRNGTATSELYLNDFGGDVIIGSASATGFLGVGTFTPAAGVEIAKERNGYELELEDLSSSSSEQTKVYWDTGGTYSWTTGVNCSTGIFYFDEYNGDAFQSVALSIDPASDWIRCYYDWTVYGTKAFAMEHPADPTKEIQYTCLEGPEVGTYIRGTAQLRDGEAVIELPEHFGYTTVEEGLTVQLTPLGEWLQLYVIEKSTARIVVREANGAGGSFDYFIQGVRSGYEDFEVIVPRGAAEAPASGDAPAHPNGSDAPPSETPAAPAENAAEGHN